MRPTRGSLQPDPSNPADRMNWVLPHGIGDLLRGPEAADWPNSPSQVSTRTNPSYQAGLIASIAPFSLPLPSKSVHLARPQPKICRMANRMQVFFCRRNFRPGHNSKFLNHWHSRQQRQTRLAPTSVKANWSDCARSKLKTSPEPTTFKYGVFARTPSSYAPFANLFLFTLNGGKIR